MSPVRSTRFARRSSAMTTWRGNTFISYSASASRTQEVDVPVKRLTQRSPCSSRSRQEENKEMCPVPSDRRDGRVRVMDPVQFAQQVVLLRSEHPSVPLGGRGATAATSALLVTG